MIGILKPRKKDRRPEAIIIGAQRCGTTSLFDRLLRHPQISGSDKKEVHFFDTNYAKGWKWYSSFFGPPVEGVVRIEATPYYSIHPHAPERIARDLPDAKLILVVRDPIQRALSHFKLSKELGREPLDLLDALLAEEERLRPELAAMVQNEKYRSKAFQNWSYKLRGRYDEQIAKWCEYFPREQLLVLQIEAMLTSPANEFEKLSSFLGIDPFSKEPIKAFNRSEAPSLDQSAVEYLREYFSDSKWLWNEQSN